MCSACHLFVRAGTTSLGVCCSFISIWQPFSISASAVLEEYNFNQTDFPVGKITVWQIANSNTLISAGMKAHMPYFLQVEVTVWTLVTIMGLKGLREQTGSRMKWPQLQVTQLKVKALNVGWRPRDQLLPRSRLQLDEP